jgi:phenylalanyl-tRNA synthetase beta chain
MPVVEVDPEELRTLVDTDRDDGQLREDLFALGLEFEGQTDEGNFELEFAPDRLDRLSVEGIARSLRYQYGTDRGVYVPSANDAEWTIEVEDPPEARPYITGAIVRGLDFTDDSLESLIQLQEKLHATMGRGREKGAVGVHDLTMLKGAPATGETAKSVTYTGMDPDEESFVPLESDEELTPREVTERHHIGEAYADLVAGLAEYPAIYDDVGLFSFPPVINGRRTEVSEGSRDLFIELTGTDQWTIDRMCTIICYSLAARGGQIERVEVSYGSDAPGEHAGDRLDQPDLSTKTKRVDHGRVESILGVDLDAETVVDCLERSGLDAVGESAASRGASAGAGTDTDASAGEDTGDGDRTYTVEIPPYRVDVLHPMDVVDDIGRAYGFNELAPRYPDVSTVGGRHGRSRLEDAARETLVGLGFEDLLNFYMTNEAENFERMRIGPEDGVVGGGDAVTIKEPYSEEYTILRTWALPSCLQVLENNTHRAYPQHLAEIGLAAVCDERENTGVAERRTVAGVLADTEASYEDARSHLQILARAFETELATPATEHPSFIDGRTAEVVLNGETAGVVGELHPAVLVEHDLELPVAAFEFRLDALQ